MVLERFDPRAIAGAVLLAKDIVILAELDPVRLITKDALGIDRHLIGLDRLAGFENLSGAGRLLQMEAGTDLEEEVRHQSSFAFREADLLVDDLGFQVFREVIEPKRLETTSQGARKFPFAIRGQDEDRTRLAVEAGPTDRAVTRNIETVVEHDVEDVGIEFRISLVDFVNKTNGAERNDARTQQGKDVEIPTVVGVIADFLENRQGVFDGELCGDFPDDLDIQESLGIVPRIDSIRLGNVGGAEQVVEVGLVGGIETHCHGDLLGDFGLAGARRTVRDDALALFDRLMDREDLIGRHEEIILLERRLELGDRRVGIVPARRR